jgi:hypothetical protein
MKYAHGTPNTHVYDKFEYLFRFRNKYSNLSKRRVNGVSFS